MKTINWLSAVTTGRALGSEQDGTAAEVTNTSLTAMDSREGEENWRQQEWTTLSRILLKRRVRSRR